MTTMPAITDDLIQAAFATRAGRGQPDGIHGLVMDAVAVTPQRGVSPGGLRIGRRSGAGFRLLAVAVLSAAALTGLAIVGGRPDTTTPPTRLVGEFVQPFEYGDDPASGLSIHFRTPSTIAFADAVGYTGYSPTGYPATPERVPIPGSWGIVLSGTAGGWIDPCPVPVTERPGNPLMGDTPGQAIDELRATAGIGLGPASPATISGHAGVVAGIDPTANLCPAAGLYMARGGGVSRTNERVMRFDVPSRLLVAEVGGSTILVQTWAWTEPDLERVKPNADAFLAGLHFTAPRGPGDAAPSPVADAAPSGRPLTEVHEVRGFTRPFEYHDASDRPMQPVYQGVNMVAFMWGIDESVQQSDYDSQFSPYGPTRDGWGLVLFPADAVTVRSCGGTGEIAVRDEPTGFLDDLRERAGIGIVGPTDRAFAGRFGPVARIDPEQHRCGVADLYIGSDRVRLNRPSRLFFTEVEGDTIAFQLWAPTEEALAAATPDVMAFLEGVDFTRPAPTGSGP